MAATPRTYPTPQRDRLNTRIRSLSNFFQNFFLIFLFWSKKCVFLCVFLWFVMCTYCVASLTENCSVFPMDIVKLFSFSVCIGFIVK